MSALPVLPLWVTKYEGNTAHLTLEEDGAYTRLLRLCWRTPGCSVPADAAWVARHMRVDGATFERAVKPILEEFFVVENGRWQNLRLLAEYQSATEKTEKRKAAGQKGGKAKALKSAKTGSSNATILPAQCSDKPDPKPDIYSEAKASGADAPETLSDSDYLWRVGASWLQERGHKHARSYLGRQRKEIGDDAVLCRIIDAAIAANPGDALEFIAAAVARHKAKTKTGASEEMPTREIVHDAEGNPVAVRDIASGEVRPLGRAA